LHQYQQNKQLHLTSNHKTQQNKELDLTLSHKTQQTKQLNLTLNYKTQQNKQPALTSNYKTQCLLCINIVSCAILNILCSSDFYSDTGLWFMDYGD
jgi:hypothetical protein